MLRISKYLQTCVGSFCSTKWFYVFLTVTGKFINLWSNFYSMKVTAECVVSKVRWMCCKNHLISSLWKLQFTDDHEKFTTNYWTNRADNLCDHNYWKINGHDFIVKSLRDKW